MKRLYGILVLLILAPAHIGWADVPGLALTLATGKAQYEQGEPIPVVMHYTYTGGRPLAVEVVTGDNSGRIQDFGFSAADAQGRPVPDPTPFPGGVAGGLSSTASLTAGRPYRQTVALNQWLRFDRPGVYTVTAHSFIVYRDDGRGPFDPKAVLSLNSGPLRLEITLPADAHRRARLFRDEVGVQRKDPEARQAALRDLRFLGDARAIPLLVRGLGDSDVSAVYEAWFGLRAFPDLAPIKAAVLRSVNGPAHTIPPSRQWPYLGLLAEADQRAQGKPFYLSFAVSPAYKALFRAKPRVRKRVGRPRGRD